MSVQIFPSKPTISSSRRDQEFVKGESVTVTCEAPSSYLGSRFYLYRRDQNAPIETDTAKSSQSGVTFNITNLLGTGSEDYSCVYKHEVSDQEIISGRSDTVKITVVDPPTIPGISLDQQTGVYQVGETVTITCTVNREYRHPIYFYRDNKPLSSHQIFTKANTGTFTIASRKEGGRYQCRYRTFIGKRQLLSQPSRAVTLTVTEPLMSPEISFDQPTGVYLEGETVTIICTLNWGYHSITYFYRNNELLSSHQLFAKDNIGTTLVTNKKQGGLYQCKYRTSIKARWLESPLSEPEMITVAGK
ncbi:Fc receptor-like protein 5 [Cetorhinus maximus]